MKIGIISDTHFPKKGKHLPLPLISGLKGVDLIIHAGDWSTLQVYHELEKIAPIKGVYGNVDDEDIRNTLPKTLLLDVNGYKIGVVHGDGKGRTTPERALHTFLDEKVDLIIFGHSHIPYHEEKNGVILFNPGSPTDKRRQPAYSYGYLEIEKQIILEHRYFI